MFLHLLFRPSHLRDSYKPILLPLAVPDVFLFLFLQISLAYLAAATHGLEKDAARLRELLEAQGMPIPEVTTTVFCDTSPRCWTAVQRCVRHCLAVAGKIRAVLRGECIWRSLKIVENSAGLRRRGVKRIRVSCVRLYVAPMFCPRRLYSPKHGTPKDFIYSN